MSKDSATNVMSTKTIILGIDPGSRCTGYGMIIYENKQTRYLASGTIRMESAPLPERLKQIFLDVSTVVQRYRPDEVAVEEVFMHRNAGSALKLGQARGAAIAAVCQQAKTIAEYTARQIKLAVAGYGNAEKIQVQHMVCQLLNLEESPPEDAADALAVALCHAHTRSYLQRIGVAV